MIAQRRQQEAYAREIFNSTNQKPIGIVFLHL
jgi:hypothetical protein